MSLLCGIETKDLNRIVAKKRNAIVIEDHQSDDNYQVHHYYFAIAMSEKETA